MTIKKLTRHKFFAHFTEGEVKLCTIAADGGADFYAGQLNWCSLPRDASQDLIDDIEETLGIKVPIKKIQSLKKK